MDDFDEDPLDLLEDDGDGVNETILLFDKDPENKAARYLNSRSNIRPGNSKISRRRETFSDP